LKNNITNISSPSYVENQLVDIYKNIKTKFVDFSKKVKPELSSLVLKEMKEAVPARSLP